MNVQHWWNDSGPRPMRPPQIPHQLVPDRNLLLRSDKTDSVLGRAVKYKALVGKAVWKRLDGSAICKKTCCGNGGLGRGLQSAS